MIKLDNAMFGYDEGNIPIKDFSFEFESGVYAVSGKSGCGKSTLLKGIAGILKPIMGSVVNTSGKCAMVFQENRLVMSYTAVKNLKLVCDSNEIIFKVLDGVELSEYKNKPVNRLSGGQQRRIAIARALAYDGDFILLDEPFEGLDDKLKNSVAKLIRERYSLIIVSSHDKTDFDLLAGEKSFVSIAL